jgi:hypothetical protein
MKKTEKKKGGVKTRWIVLGSILVVLVIARLMLPFFVTRYVNKVLSDIPGYRGSIYDVDIRLFRGAYVIDSLKLVKIDGNQEVPFIDIPVTDLSIEWRALFEGAIVGKVTFQEPKLNFIGGHEGSEEGNNQFGTEADWTDPIKKLMPLQINRLEIIDGRITFFDFTTKPNVDLNLSNLDLLATNLNNASDQPERLPSHIIVSAQSIGGGDLHIDMNINVLKPIPDLDMDLRFEGVDMPALNDFFRAYSNTDIEKGVFNMYVEMTIDSNNVTGYVKPLAQDVRVVSLKEDGQKPLNLLWQAVVGFLAEVFENQKEDQLATRVPMDGDLNNIEAGVWPTVWNIFRNAFVKAFERNIDDTVEFTNSDVSPGDTRKEKRTQRKEEREARKKDRKSKS